MVSSRPSLRSRLLVFVTVATASAGLVLAGPPQPARSAETLTPAAICSRAEERFRNLTDYHCLAEGTATNGKKTEGGTYRVWFRQPRLARIKVVKGRSRGCEITVDARGQVRARRGGLLKPFVVRLKPNDDRLLSIRDVSIVEITWDAFFRRWRQNAAQPGARVTMAPRPTPDAPHEVVVSWTQNGKQFREHYHVDPKLWVLLEAELWENGSRVDHIQFRDIELNTGVEERFFRL